VTVQPEFFIIVNGSCNRNCHVTISSYCIKCYSWLA